MGIKEGWVAKMDERARKAAEGKYRCKKCGLLYDPKLFSCPRCRCQQGYGGNPTVDHLTRKY